MVASACKTSLGCNWLKAHARAPLLAWPGAQSGQPSMLHLLLQYLQVHFTVELANLSTRTSEGKKVGDMTSCVVAGALRTITWQSSPQTDVSLSTICLALWSTEVLPSADLQMHWPILAPVSTWKAHSFWTDLSNPCANNCAIC